MNLQQRIRHVVLACMIGGLVLQIAELVRSAQMLRDHDDDTSPCWNEDGSPGCGAARVDAGELESDPPAVPGAGLCSAPPADPSAAHEDIGRLDQRCQVCHRPDRDPVHKIEGDRGAVDR